MKLTVKVKTGAREEYVRPIEDGRLEVAVNEPPDKGKANRAVVRALAEHFHVPQSHVSIVAGHASRSKIVEIR